MSNLCLSSWPDGWPQELSIIQFFVEQNASIVQILALEKKKAIPPINRVPETTYVEETLEDDGLFYFVFC